ncbi:MAG: prepilin-type N-terminal cleavage/methylation domain-containing protein [Lachnospiraceae bacterium]|nr:prepilin-type N-terminal cleavage/methylation domain-containing protein [Lachnospiraceae bacterium]
MVRLQKMQKRKSLNNKGFSLVEVLVCIALLAVISVPIFAGIRTSAKLNFNAHNTQMLTSYAQEELEIVKALSVDAYTQRMSSAGVAKTDIIDGSDFPDQFTRSQTIQSAFSDIASLSAQQKKELFTPFYFQQPSVTIGNQTYLMNVIFEPAPYSVENAGTDTMASDINVSSLLGTVEADGAIYPVITDEINQYEGSDGTNDTIVANLKVKLNALGIDKTADEIATQMTKRVDVDVAVETDGAGKKQVRVTCDVTYSCDTAEVYYRVYNGTYPYAPTVSEKAANPAIMDAPGETSGGNVFIFAKAYQPAGVTVSNAAHCKNVISITGGADTDAPVNVYLVRGYTLNPTGTFKTDYNFDEVLVNGVNYLSSSDMLSRGQASFGDGRFVSNIHSNSWDRSGNVDGTEAELEKLLGSGDYAARCYHVTVELFDGSGKKVAFVESTKTEH